MPPTLTPYSRPRSKAFRRRRNSQRSRKAQTLLAALAETDEVKNAAASRQRRLELQTSYGRAMMWSRGFSSEEAKAAFTRAQELATGIDDPTERFTTYYGQWVGCLLRGELGLARQAAEIFLRDAENGARMTEAAVARRVLGLTCFSQGDFSQAQAHLEEALRIYDPERDREAKFSFSLDTGSAATAYLAHINWLFGNVGRAQELIEEAVERAIKSGHVPTLSNAYHFKAIFEMLRGDAAAAERVAENLVELSREHGLTLYMAWGRLFLCWAHAWLPDTQTGATELRLALAAYTDQGNKLFVPFFQGLVAEIEAEEEDAERPRAGSMKRWRSRARRENTGPMLSCIASAAKFCSSATRRIRRRPRKPSSRPLPSRSSRRQGVLSCARQRTWRGFVAIRASVMRLATFSFQSTAGSPKASTRLI